MEYDGPPQISCISQVIQPQQKLGSELVWFRGYSRSNIAISGPFSSTVYHKKCFNYCCEHLYVKPNIYIWSPVDAL